LWTTNVIAAGFAATMSTAVGLFGLAANPMLKLLAYITAEGSIGAV